ncbi:MAG: hypothetical protein DF280_02065 ['Brassica napus' phytoplasma]|nr:MAG: hypothetical protein DF280_02065 ['Brassica napus' phytoplasma]
MLFFFYLNNKLVFCFFTNTQNDFNYFDRIIKLDNNHIIEDISNKKLFRKSPFYLPTFLHTSTNNYKIIINQ